MDQREVTVLCLLDYSRCFDCIPHSSLLRKLELYGVDTRWFRSYLANHYQRVQLHSTTLPDRLVLTRSHSRY